MTVFQKFAFSLAMILGMFVSSPVQAANPVEDPFVKLTITDASVFCDDSISVTAKWEDKTLLQNVNFVSMKFSLEQGCTLIDSYTYTNDVLDRTYTHNFYELNSGTYTVKVTLTYKVTGSCGTPYIIASVNVIIP